MKILVNKCPHTGQLFEDDGEYVRHIRKIQREQRAQAKYKAERLEFETWLNQEKAKIYTIDEIPGWIVKNQRRLIDGYKLLNPHTWDKMYPSDEIKSIKLVDLRYCMASNSHCCPKNGVTNWGGRGANLPRGYMGYRGNVSASLARLPRHNGSYPMSNFLKMIGIHTVGGLGGGNESSSWDVTVFIDDWAGLAEAKAFEILKNV